MENQITLANGDVTQPEKMRHYFDTVFAAEDSGKKFAVNLEHVWRIGYATKEAAVKALTKNFAQDVDYQFLVQLDENLSAGRPAKKYVLTVSCLEYFVVRNNRDVFEIYRQCRQAVKKLLDAVVEEPQYVLPRSYKEALCALLGEVEQKEKLEQALVEAQPKVAFFDAVAIATGSIAMSVAAKMLKIAGMGRNGLFRMLRADKILRANNEPYQRYAEYFQVEPKPYDAGKDGAKGKRLATVTRVTPSGLQYLSRKYKAQQA